MSALTYLHNDVAAVMRSQSTDKKDKETREVIPECYNITLERKSSDLNFTFSVPTACHATFPASRHFK
jgi:hypothetical protein